MTRVSKLLSAIREFFRSEAGTLNNPEVRSCLPNSQDAATHLQIRMLR